MIRFLPLALLGLIPALASARPTFVCQIAARIPFSADIRTGFDSTRIFTQTAGLVEERRSGNSVLHRWTVISDTPEQMVAVDESRKLTLIIDRPGFTFAESGLQVQRRGYCRVNELP
jgi:hypothetical protein